MTIQLAQSPAAAKRAPCAFYARGACCFVCTSQTAPLEAAHRAQSPDDHHPLEQPQTPEELEQVCIAVKSCCGGSLRYGGTDPAIIHRLGNDPKYSDFLIDAAGRVVPKDRLLPPKWWQFWKTRRPA
ncbi:MAG TPA: hypothetical protein VIL86_06600 [Tepidisphaeraceae bacterium]|jgi:hypothetical protein